MIVSFGFVGLLGFIVSQRQRPAVGLRDVDAEDQPHPRVLPPDVRLPLAELDVRVSELQDPGAVDAAGNKSLRSAPDPCPIPGDRSPKGLCGPAQGPGTGKHVKEGRRVEGEREREREMVCRL